MASICDEEKHKMNPLAITFDQFDQTNHGKKNLDILRQIGVDHVHFTMNPLLIKKLVKTGFRNNWRSLLG